MVEVYVVSAFSKGNQGGNKAGVVLDCRSLTPADMAAIAKDLGYSETAFLIKSNVADFKIRYFTPTEEVPLCGHATIATFSLLHSLGKLDKDAYTIETIAGTLNIRIEKDGMIFMEQNHPTYFETLKPEIFAECFENRFIDTALPIQIVSTGLKDVMLPVCKTIFLRIFVMGILLAISAFVMFRIVPFDKNLFMAMILLFSLPAPFIIPLYADVDSEGIYISTTLSMHTLVTIFIFVGLSVYAIN